MALILQIVDVGINSGHCCRGGDGRGLAAAIALGAQGVPNGKQFFLLQKRPNFSSL